ncbi:Proline-rich receptor-like protein kinase PERK9, partial [Ophiophagus hannah]
MLSSFSLPSLPTSSRETQKAITHPVVEYKQQTNVRYLFLKLWDWRESKNNIANEQSGFRTGRSTIDYYSVFQHLAEKYTARLCGALNPDFIALKSHFDSILLDNEVLSRYVQFSQKIPSIGEPFLLELCHTPEIEPCQMGIMAIATHLEGLLWPPVPGHVAQPLLLLIQPLPPPSLSEPPQPSSAGPVNCQPSPLFATTIRQPGNTAVPSALPPPLPTTTASSLLPPLPPNTAGRLTASSPPSSMSSAVSRLIEHWEKNLHSTLSPVSQDGQNSANQHPTPPKEESRVGGKAGSPHSPESLKILTHSLPLTLRERPSPWTCAVKGGEEGPHHLERGSGIDTEFREVADFAKINTINHLQNFWVLGNCEEPEVKFDEQAVLHDVLPDTKQILEEKTWIVPLSTFLDYTFVKSYDIMIQYHHTKDMFEGILNQGKGVHTESHHNWQSCASYRATLLSGPFSLEYASPSHNFGQQTNLSDLLQQWLMGEVSKGTDMICNNEKQPSHSQEGVPTFLSFSEDRVPVMYQRLQESRKIHRMAYSNNGQEIPGMQEPRLHLGMSNYSSSTYQQDCFGIPEFKSSGKQKQKKQSENKSSLALKQIHLASNSRRVPFLICISAKCCDSCVELTSLKMKLPEDKAISSNSFIHITLKMSKATRREKERDSEKRSEERIDDKDLCFVHLSADSLIQALYKSPSIMPILHNLSKIIWKDSRMTSTGIFKISIRKKIKELEGNQTPLGMGSYDPKSYDILQAYHIKSHVILERKQLDLSSNMGPILFNVSKLDGPNIPLKEANCPSLWEQSRFLHVMHGFILNIFAEIITNKKTRRCLVTITVEIFVEYTYFANERSTFTSERPIQKPSLANKS